MNVFAESVKEEEGRLCEAVEPMKLVPCLTLEKTEKELRLKDDTIHALTAKVKHLESLVKLKDQRIKDLSLQLEHYQETSPRRSAKAKSKFTGNFEMKKV